MVCRADQTCRIEFSPSYGAKLKPVSSDKYVLRTSTRGKDLYDYIEEQWQLDPETFKLYLMTSQKMIDLSQAKEKTMSEIGVDFVFEPESSEVKHRLIVTDSRDFPFLHIHEGGIPGKKEPAIATSTVAPPAHVPQFWAEEGSCLRQKGVERLKAFFKPETNFVDYVGLVNQAMTCYLNSLLQALYMTPEFRNALYNWEYVDGSEKDEANSIPYQLQKLFLNLQTSTKSAVETTALTKSFGWDSTEAWQQHDIQELCRVMFDALEQKFMNTEQADLINRLYEGKMIDYVKCLECGTEKTREDTFLDIPLPVRPFDSNVTYNSVEEAMRAFVQYETLEGANQYHCEKCNKKCDAHKGLKFTKFPYLLTLHLKRFDFDYKTFHRIKLNDKVTFPDVLNLNSFIPSTPNQESPAAEEDIGVGVKCDDSSTTDSGTLDDDCPPCENNLPNSNHSPNHDQDDDEGIDISNGPSTSNCSTHNHENEKNRGNCVAAKGPYIYELFSIMIHSGSASGGHYYAFIKDFRTQKWVSFNDQNVTQITHDDIQKTYGGGPTRAYYSGAYSSSTNAYMLMYRQIDPARNALPMQVEDFPKHIQELLKKMKESEDNDRINHEKQMSVPRLKIYCDHPTQEKLMDITLYVMPDVIWSEVTEEAYSKFHLEKVVSLDQCRLVSYDHYNDVIESSYDGREQETLASIADDQYSLTFLLEIRRKDQKFETYLPGGVMTKVFVIDVPAEDLIEGPISVRGLLTQTVREYKQMIGKIINIDPEQMKLVIKNYLTESTLVENFDNNLEAEAFFNSTKVLVSTMLDTDSSIPFHESALYEIAEIIEHVISVQVQLPDTSKEILEDLNIPPLAEKAKDKEKPVVNEPSKLTVSDANREVSPKCNDVAKTARSSDDAPARNMSPQLVEGEEWNTPEQSNSEDSSLSDSDKTLVGDVPEDFDFHVLLPPSKRESRTVDVLSQTRMENWDVEDNHVYYFKATPQPSNDKLLKVILDNRMKLSFLKKSLEPYVGVSADFFKVFHNAVEFGKIECSCLTEQLSSFEEGEKLTIKLGRVLRTGEFKIKLYQLLIDSAEPFKLLCEWIVSKDMTVGQAKKQILAELKRKYDIDIPYERFRLRNKYYRTVSKVCLDDQTFEDIQFYSQFEMIMQELPDKEPVTDSNQVVLFVRRWSPSKMQLGPFQEIVLDEKSVEELGKKLSAISGIPEEYIDIARGNGSFPGETCVLRIQYNHDWNHHMVCFDDLSLSIANGCVFLYRDNREKVKQLTHDEMKELVMKESSPLIPQSATMNNSRRRERGLKIYLDTK